MDRQTHLFESDGLVPNNPRLPLLVYRQALELPATKGEQALIARFLENGWGDAWVDGIYDFQHYHATAHEVLGMAQGWAEVQFGGPAGPVLRMMRGDAVLIPAGVGHCRRKASTDFSVVGAYPHGQRADLRRELQAGFADAAARIALVPLPAADPIVGGPPWSA